MHKFSDFLFLLFVAAASQAHAFCYGMIGPTIGTCFAWCEASVVTQQPAEPFGLCAAIHLAIHRRWKHFFLFSDNEASINQILGLRASIGPKVQQTTKMIVEVTLTRTPQITLRTRMCLKAPKV